MDMSPKFDDGLAMKKTASLEADATSGAGISVWASPEAGAAWLSNSGPDASPLACCVAALASAWNIDLERLAPRLGW
jgi:hypothetical protein